MIEFLLDLLQPPFSPPGAAILGVGVMNVLWVAWVCWRARAGKTPSPLVALLPVYVLVALLPLGGLWTEHSAWSQVGGLDPDQLPAAWSKVKQLAWAEPPGAVALVALPSFPLLFVRDARATCLALLVALCLSAWSAAGNIHGFIDHAVVNAEQRAEQVRQEQVEADHTWHLALLATLVASIPLLVTGARQRPLLLVTSAAIAVTLFVGNPAWVRARPMPTWTPEPSRHDGERVLILETEH
jgi:hypothetical protein